MRIQHLKSLLAPGQWFLGVIISDTPESLSCFPLCLLQ